MVVRHLDNDELILGWQNENGNDEKGKTKGGKNGYITKNMYCYNNELYNLHSLCKHCEVSYRTVYSRLRNGHVPTQVFDSLGVYGVREIRV